MTFCIGKTSFVRASCQWDRRGTETPLMASAPARLATEHLAKTSLRTESTMTSRYSMTCSTNPKHPGKVTERDPRVNQKKEGDVGTPPLR